MSEMNAMKSEIIDMLITLIPDAVKEIQVPIEDKVCYIALYRSDSHPLVGLIQLGIETRRNKMKDEAGIWGAWNSGDQPVKHQNDLNDELLKEKLKRLLEICGESGGYEGEWYEAEWWIRCTEIMNEVSLKLNEYEWNSYFKNITDDFVVYVDREDLDVENGDLELCVPQNKLKLLKGKGLV
ncbi:hypothetical protein [Paenibacillus oleatilyticus]|uniref:hypothetical protein n=1 Tax=Paenibacillus oleatilyticus TaxID=2594886 RepID=UPI001C1F6EBB|nr:hypothetical protein [Paenibacillus oleatilyticus]MBU7317141.1 hypothetical protein [Paenibacillus oleatilyticus]